jgi:hypothetical protein
MVFTIEELQVGVDNVCDDVLDEYSSKHGPSLIVSNPFEEHIETEFAGNMHTMIQNISEYMNSEERQSGDASHPAYVYEIQQKLFNTLFKVKEDSSTGRKSLTVGANVFISDQFMLFITGKLIPFGETNTYVL